VAAYEEQIQNIFGNVFLIASQIAGARGSMRDLTGNRDPVDEAAGVRGAARGPQPA
jgi:hypothetical protein